MLGHNTQMEGFCHHYTAYIASYAAMENWEKFCSPVLFTMQIIDALSQEKVWLKDELQTANEKLKAMEGHSDGKELDAVWLWMM